MDSVLRSRLFHLVLVVLTFQLCKSQQDAAAMIQEADKIMSEFDFLVKALRPKWEEIKEARTVDPDSQRILGEVFRVKKKDETYVYQSRMLVKAPPAVVFEVVWDRSSDFKNWHPEVADSRVLQQLDPLTSISYSATRKLGPLEPRDFVNLCKARVNLEKGEFTKAFRSVEWPAMPPLPGFTRAQAFVGGFQIKAHPRNPNMSLVTLLNHNDLKLNSIPVKLVNDLSPRAMKKSMESLAHEAEKIFQQNSRKQ